MVIVIECGSKRFLDLNLVLLDPLWCSLCLLAPEMIIPELLEKLTLASESLTEPHRFHVCIQVRFRLAFLPVHCSPVFHRLYQCCGSGSCRIRKLFGWIRIRIREKSFRIRAPPDPKWIWNETTLMNLKWNYSDKLIRFQISQQKEQFKKAYFSKKKFKKLEVWHNLVFILQKHISWRNIRNKVRNKNMKRWTRIRKTCRIHNTG